MAIMPVRSFSQRSNYNVNFEGKKHKEHQVMSRPISTSIKAVPLAALIAMSPMTPVNANPRLENGRNVIELAQEPQNSKFTEKITDVLPPRTFSTDDGYIKVYVQHEQMKKMPKESAFYETIEARNKSNINNIVLKFYNKKDELEKSFFLKNLQMNSVIAMSAYGTADGLLTNLLVLETSQDIFSKTTSLYNPEIYDYLSKAIDNDPTSLFRISQSASILNIPTTISYQTYDGLTELKDVTNIPKNRNFGKKIEEGGVEGNLGGYAIRLYENNNDKYLTLQPVGDFGEARINSFSADLIGIYDYNEQLIGKLKVYNVILEDKYYITDEKLVKYLINLYNDPDYKNLFNGYENYIVYKILPNNTLEQIKNDK